MLGKAHANGHELFFYAEAVGNICLQHNPLANALGLQ